MNVECILFGLEDVLFDYEAFREFTAEKCAKAMVKHGLKASRKEIVQYLLQGEKIDRGRFEELCISYNRHIDPFIIGSGLLSYQVTFQESIVPFENAKKVMKKLMDYPLAVIATGDQAENAMRLINMNLDKFFINEKHRNCLFCSSTPEKLPPKSFLWNLAQYTLGFSYERSIMVCGKHNWSELLGANLLGLITVVIEPCKRKIRHDIHQIHSLLNVGDEIKASNFSLEKVAALLRPDVTISALEDLPKLIHRLNKKKIRVF